MGSAIDVNFYLTDGKGKESVVTLPIPSTVAVTDLIPFALSAWDLINPLVTGGNVVARVSIPVPGIVSANPVGSGDVQEIGRFLFRAANGALKRLGLPTFLESKMVPGTGDIDTTDADVAAFVTGMTTGIDTTGDGGSGVIQPCNLWESDLDSLEAAFEDWGKLR